MHIRNIFVSTVVCLGFFLSASGATRAENQIDSSGNSCYFAMQAYYEVLHSTPLIRKDVRLALPLRIDQCCKLLGADLGKETRERSSKTSTTGDFNVDAGFKTVTFGLKESTTKEDESKETTEAPPFKVPKNWYGYHGFALYQTEWSETINIRQLKCQGIDLTNAYWASDTSKPTLDEKRVLTQVFWVGENDGPAPCSKIAK